MLTKKQLITKGILAVAPHMFSVIPFGIVCGAIGIELGFSPISVYAISIIIFGGAIFGGNVEPSMHCMMAICIIVSGKDNSATAPKVQIDSQYPYL